MIRRFPITFKLSRIGQGGNPRLSAPDPQFIFGIEIGWNLVETSNHDFHLLVGHRKGATAARGAIASASVGVCETRVLFESRTRPNRKCREWSATRLTTIRAMANAYPQGITRHPKRNAATNATTGSKRHVDLGVHNRPPFRFNGNLPGNVPLCRAAAWMSA
jgi:hypothetical protein